MDNNSTVMDNIFLLMKQNKINARNLSLKIGKGASYISDMRTKGITPSYDVIVKIADCFNVTTDFLLGKAPQPPSTGIHIPVLGHVAAGIPITAVQDILDYEEITPDMAAQGEFFALKIKGDSMAPRIADGDIVIVKQQEGVESGDVAVVLVNGQDATVKKVYKHESGITLTAANPVYPPTTYTNEQIEKMPVTIIGKVVELRAKF